MVYAKRDYNWMTIWEPVQFSNGKNSAKLDRFVICLFYGLMAQNGIAWREKLLWSDLEW
jgi:hypothetical protein